MSELSQFLYGSGDEDDPPAGSSLTNFLYGDGAAPPSTTTYSGTPGDITSKFEGTLAAPTHAIEGPGEDPGFWKFALEAIKRATVTPATGVLETFGLDIAQGKTAAQKANFEDVQARFLENSEGTGTGRFLASLFTRLAADALPLIPGGAAAKVGQGGAQLAARAGAKATGRKFAAGALPTAIEGGLIGLGETADSDDLGTRIVGTFLGTALGGTAGGLVRLKGSDLITDPLDPEVNKIVKFWKKNMTSRGMLPEEVFQAIGSHQHALSRAVADVGSRASEMDALVGRYQKVNPDYNPKALEDYVLREIEKPSAKQVFAEIDDPGLRKEFLEAGQRMRETINATTKLLEESGAAGYDGSDLIAVLQRGRSEAADTNYLARTYDEFSGDAGRNWKELVFDGKATFWDPVAKRERPVFKAAYEFLQSEFSKDGIDVDPDDILNFMHAVVSKGRDESAWQRMGGKVSKPFRDLFKKRQEIPDPILALLGEKRTAATRYYDTVIGQTRMLEDFKLSQQIKEMGDGKLFWTNASEVPGGPGKAIAVAAEKVGGEPRYTTPELHEILFGGEIKSDASWLQFANALSKQLKTVYSVQTQARNFLANPLLLMMNGHSPFARGGLQTFGNLAEFRMTGRLTANEAKREFILDGIKHGVFGENVHFGDLEFYEKELGRFLEAKGSKTIADRFNRFKTGSLNRAVKGGYQLGDEYWKAVLWQKEIKEMRWVHPDKPLAEIKKEAAKLVRDQMPTYSMVASGIQRLRRNPLVGTFVSFPAEMFRTFKNTAKRGMWEAFGDHGNSRLRFVGTKRLAGITAALTAPAYASQLLRHPNATPEREEAVRAHVAPWEQASEMVITRLDPEKKEFEAFDTSFLDPLSYLKKPFLAMLGSRYVDEDELGALWQEFSDTFIGPELATTAVIEVLSNKKGVPLLTSREGGDVYNPKDSTATKLGKSAERVGRALAPGSLTSLHRILRAAAGTGLGVEAGFNEVLSPYNRYGKKYELSRELLALVGPRLTATSLPTSLSFRARDLGRARNDARQIYTREKNNTRSTPARRQRARQRAQKVWEKSFLEFQNSVAASRVLGMEDAEILRLLDSLGVAKEDARRLVMGVGPRRLTLK